MYNLYDEDDTEDVEGLKEKLEDNDKTKGKMKLLRSKMENMIITRKVGWDLLFLDISFLGVFLLKFRSSYSSVKYTSLGAIANPKCCSESTMGC